MDPNCVIDVVKVAKELKSLLKAHDKVVREISVLDAQIDQINRGLLIGDLHGQNEHPSLCHVQLSVLGGVRHMLNQYRLRKFRQIQTLSRSIIGTLMSDDIIANDGQPIPSDLDNSPVTVDSAAVNYTTLSRECYREDMLKYGEWILLENQMQKLQLVMQKMGSGPR